MAKARAYYVVGEHCNILLVTDGAWENDQAGGGFVLVDTSDNYRLAGSVLVDPRLIGAWKKTGVEQLISQIELFVLVVIRFHFRERLMSRKIVAWIDNESARFAAIKAISHSKLMVGLTHETEMHWQCFLWCDRVCSYFNRSDGPSHGKVKETCQDLGLSGEYLQLPLMLQSFRIYFD